jgi:hypothetical protein
VSAVGTHVAQVMGGRQRRNIVECPRTAAAPSVRIRAGGPILTMDREPSAVLTAVLAGRATPRVPQLWVQLPLAARGMEPLALPRRNHEVKPTCGCVDHLPPL